MLRYPYNKLNFNITATPMKHIFTPKEMRPSEKTINLIKQIAYTCRAIKVNGTYEVFCLN